MVAIDLEKGERATQYSTVEEEEPGSRNEGKKETFFFGSVVAIERETREREDTWGCDTVEEEGARTPLREGDDTKTHTSVLQRKE